MTSVDNRSCQCQAVREATAARRSPPPSGRSLRHPRAAGSGGRPTRRRRAGPRRRSPRGRRSVPPATGADPHWSPVPRASGANGKNDPVSPQRSPPRGPATYRFQPVLVPTGTAMSTVRIPATSCPSRSVVGTSTRYEPPRVGAARSAGHPAIRTWARSRAHSRADQRRDLLTPSCTSVSSSSA